MDSCLVVDLCWGMEAGVFYSIILFTYAYPFKEKNIPTDFFHLISYKQKDLISDKIIHSTGIYILLIYYYIQVEWRK